MVKMRRQQDSEIAGGEQHQGRDCEPAHDLGLRFRQQWQRRGDRNHAGGDGEAPDRGARIERQKNSDAQPADEQHEGRRQQGGQPPHIVPRGQHQGQQRKPAEGRIGRYFIAGGDLADLHVAEIFERMQRYPGQQKRTDEGAAAHDIHHLLALDFADDGVHVGNGDEAAHVDIFEAL